MTEKDLCAEAIILSGVEPKKCMRCGKCSGACPSYEEMEYHPHEFVYMIEKGQFNKLSQSQSLYKCLSCFVCVERCPRNVMPANIIEAVKSLTMRKRDADRHSTDEIPSFSDENTPQQLLMAAMRKYSK